MQLTLTILSCLVAMTWAIPVSHHSIEPELTTPLPPTKEIQNEAIPKLTKMAAPTNPYRFTYKVSSAIRSASKPSAASESAKMTKQNPASDKNSEKNWLLTKAWLIDNINRLRSELSELERDYSQHLNSMDRTSAQKEKQMLEDMNKLRADHTVLSQQQKQIMYFIKKNQMFRNKPMSANDIHYQPLSIKSSKDSPIRRQIKRDLSQSYGDTFESETRRNMKEIFSEVSSLHDISLTLFDGLRSLETRVETRDKLFN